MITDQINQGIKEAMLSKKQLRLDNLRMLKSKILTVDARGQLPDAEVIKLFKTYYGNLQEALEQAKAANRSVMVDKLVQELAIIQKFLPQALSPEETKRIVAQAIAESGAKTKKEMGLVMKGIMKINSSVDGKIANELARQMLAD
ncbi:MAG: GatB/YqeY domain-containing protein [Parachlamydia sp.]|nr:GatB/YqeY domain-containing protein [Parachlamydia sp.]